MAEGANDSLQVEDGKTDVPIGKEVQPLEPSECLFEGCTMNATHNFDGAEIAVVCHLHQAEGMVCLIQTSSMEYSLDKDSSRSSKFRQNRCQQESCDVWANYAFPGESKGSRCSKHKSEGMVMMKPYTICKHEGCDMTAFYNFKGSNQPAYCKFHTDRTTMVRITKRECEQASCTNEPCFNFCPEPGSNKNRWGRFCSKHKLSGMVNVKHKVCVHPGCAIQASYGNKGDKTGTYCSKHKLEGMVLPKRCSCREPDCSKAPTFGLPGQGKRYCKDHTKPGMVPIKPVRRCGLHGCDEPQAFKFRGQRDSAVCAKHKLEGMVPLVVRERCEVAGCLKMAHYGVEGEAIPRLCPMHRHDGMVKIVPRGSGGADDSSLTAASVVGVPVHCAFGECVGWGVYGLSQDPRAPRYCPVHRIPDGMMHVGRAAARARAAGSAARLAAAVARQGPVSGGVVGAAGDTACELLGCAGREHGPPGEWRGRFCRVHCPRHFVPLGRSAQGEQGAAAGAEDRPCENAFCGATAAYVVAKGGSAGEGSAAADAGGGVAAAVGANYLQGALSGLGGAPAKVAVTKAPGSKEEARRSYFCALHRPAGLGRPLWACGTAGCPRWPLFSFDALRPGRACLTHRARGQLLVYPNVWLFEEGGEGEGGGLVPLAERVGVY